MQRHFLWKHQAASEEAAIILGIVSKRSPSVKVRQRILNAAYQAYKDSKQALFVVGELQCEKTNNEGITVELNAIRGRPELGQARSADFLASCRFCRLAEARSPNETVADLVEDVRSKQFSLGVAAAPQRRPQGDLLRQLAQYFSLDIHGKLEGPQCSLDVSFVCFERRLKAKKIKHLPLAENATSQVVKWARGGLSWGWVYTSKGSCQLLQKDDTRQDVTGVWVSGVESLHHPFVWLVCQQFLDSVQPTPAHALPRISAYQSSSWLPQRHSPKEIFALILFDAAFDPTSYTVVPMDEAMRTVVFGGIEKTTVTTVFSARDRIVEVPLDFCYVDDGNFTFNTTSYAGRNATGRTDFQALESTQKERIDQRTGSPSQEDSSPRLGGIAEPPKQIDSSENANLPNRPEVSTPAAVGLPRQPKRLLISDIQMPSQQTAFDSLDSPRFSPTNSTPIDRFGRDHRPGVSGRVSGGVSEKLPDDANSPRNDRPLHQSEELMDIIRKQQLEISLLKEQLQMLITNSCNNSNDRGSHKSSEPSPESCTWKRLPPEVEPGYLRRQRNSLDKENEIPSMSSTSPTGFASNVPTAQRVQEICDDHYRYDPIGRNERSIPAEIGVNLIRKDGQLSDGSNSVGSFVTPRLASLDQIATVPIGHERKPEDVGGTASVDPPVSVVLAPRLQYESLILGGERQPSAIVNQVTKKYFGKSPQFPTGKAIVNVSSNIVSARTSPTGRVSPPKGMLRRVLTAEATKQVFGQNGSDEVSMLTRKYVQMQADVQENTPLGGTGRKEGFNLQRRNSAENNLAHSPERFLDVDALRNQPKLL